MDRNRGSPRRITSSPLQSQKSHPLSYCPQDSWVSIFLPGCPRIVLRLTYCHGLIGLSRIIAFKGLCNVICMHGHIVHPFRAVIFLEIGLSQSNILIVGPRFSLISTCESFVIYSLDRFKHLLYICNRIVCLRYTFINFKT